MNGCVNWEEDKGFFEQYKKESERMITYEVSKLPNRKQYCLLRTEENRSTIIAWFVSKEAADQFKKELAR